MVRGRDEGYTTHEIRHPSLELEESYVLKSIRGFFDNINKNAEDQRQAAQEEIDRLQRGQMSIVQSALLLEPSELCFMEGVAEYHRTLKSGVKTTSGTLTVTNTRLIFTSSNNTANWELGLSKIMSVDTKNGSSTFELNASGSRGAGKFVTRTKHAGLIVESAAKLYKRLLEMPVDGGAQSRQLSQAVKAAVWQRDQGRCVQCQANDYLEFDHVIPFSKGGANTEGNIQLLCRRCNLAKGARI